MKNVALVLASLVLWLGCDDSTSTPNASPAGGASSTTGTGGANSIGSDGVGGSMGPAAGSSTRSAAPALGAANLTVANSATATAGYTCGEAHALKLGELDASGILSVPGALTDGQQKAVVKCTLRGDANREVYGQLEADGIALSLQGSVASNETPGTATVMLFDPTLIVSMRDNNCTLQVTTDFTAARKFSANVRCDRLVSVDDIHLWCSLTATVAFSECD